MDYEGNYFPEEDNSPKKVKIAKKTLRYILYGLVALVYLIAFTVIINNRELSMYKEYVFSPAASALYSADPDGFEVYELFPTTFMNYDGSVQIAGVGYAATANELELGIKYNQKLNNDETGYTPRFVLKDTNGSTYEICNVVNGKKGRYYYLRVCFAGVELPLEENAYINSDVSAAVEGEGEMYETFKYVLEIYTEGNDEPEEILVFNNVTPIQLTKFK